MSRLETTLGPYEILAHIGTGSTSQVYRARHRSGGPEIALKVLSNRLTEDSDWLRRFQREAHLLIQLKHPNTVAIHRWGQCEGRWFMELELVTGRSLRDWIDTRPRSLFLTRVGAQFANGLAASHALGLVHRDLKPSNLILTAEGLLKILDFGLARPIDPEQHELPTALQELTGHGSVVGTPRYMSPEQSLGHLLCPASDVFCMGICLFELSAGRHPFASPFPRQVQLNIREATTPDLGKYRPDLDSGFIEVVTRMLNKDIEKRPTAAEVSQLLVQLAKHSG